MEKLNISALKTLGLFHRDEVYPLITLPKGAKTVTNKPFELEGETCVIMLKHHEGLGRRLFIYLASDKKFTEPLGIVADSYAFAEMKSGNFHV